MVATRLPSSGGSVATAATHASAAVWTSSERLYLVFNRATLDTMEANASAPAAECTPRAKWRNSRFSSAKYRLSLCAV